MVQLKHRLTSAYCDPTDQALQASLRKCPFPYPRHPMAGAGDKAFITVLGNGRICRQAIAAISSPESPEVIMPRVP